MNDTPPPCPFCLDDLTPIDGGWWCWRDGELFSLDYDPAFSGPGGLDDTQHYASSAGQ